VRRFEAHHPTAGGRYADRACRVGAEPGVTQARGQCGCGSSAGTAGVATRVERIEDVAEVWVLRGDAVGELVQVRLADDGVAGRLEARDGLGGLFRDMVTEDRGAVSRPQPGGVEQVLDAQANTLPVLVGDGQERIELVLSSSWRRRCKSRR
jgi:hypothetical protein